MDALSFGFGGRLVRQAAYARAAAIEIAILTGHLFLYPTGILQEREARNSDGRRLRRDTARHPHRRPQPPARCCCCTASSTTVPFSRCCAAPCGGTAGRMSGAQLLAADLRHPHRRRAAGPPCGADLRADRPPPGGHRGPQPRRADRPLLRRSGWAATRGCAPWSRWAPRTPAPGRRRCSTRTRSCGRCARTPTSSRSWPSPHRDAAPASWLSGAIWTRLMIPAEAARLDHPDLIVRNVHVAGVGHLTMPVHAAIAAGIRQALIGEETACGGAAWTRATRQRCRPLRTNSTVRPRTEKRPNAHRGRPGILPKIVVVGRRRIQSPLILLLPRRKRSWW